MTAPSPSPCSFPVDWSCVPSIDTTNQAEKRQESADAAVAVLWALTGRRFGCCETLVRPCLNVCEPYNFPAYPIAGTLGSPWGYAYLDGYGRWQNMTCGCKGRSCSATGPRVIHLLGPVCDVVEVVIDGLPLADTEYQLEGNLLYRKNGEWPSQDLQAPLGEPGTWSVLYTAGGQPPAGTARMVGVLTAEFFKSCCGQACKLPAGVRAVQRNGVSFEIPDPRAIIAAGFTGIPEVDLWIQTWNPNHLQQAPVVSSPEFPNGL